MIYCVLRRSTPKAIEDQLISTLDKCKLILFQKTFETQFPSVGFLPASSGGLWKGLIIIGLLIGAVVAFYTSVRFISIGSL